MSDLANPSDASNAPVLLKPGQFVTVKRTGVRGVVIGHEMDRGTVTYRVGYANGEVEGGFLVKELMRED